MTPPTPTASEARLRELASVTAQELHLRARADNGHKLLFSECPHPDCALVRSLRETERPDCEDALRDICDDAIGESSDPLLIVKREVIEVGRAALAPDTRAIPLDACDDDVARSDVKQRFRCVSRQSLLDVICDLVLGGDAQQEQAFAEGFARGRTQMPYRAAWLASDTAAALSPLREDTDE